MSRWPSAMEQTFRQHESDERFRRVEAVMERRRREYALARALGPVIEDRDPGDEDRGTP